MLKPQIPASDGSVDALFQLPLPDLLPPIHAVDILAVIVSQKLKRQLGEASRSKSMRDPSNGMATLQNEIGTGRVRGGGTRVCRATVGHFLSVDVNE
jgi:hypothetical protein